MAKRLYLCPIVGTGTRQNPYRPKVADYPIGGFSIVAQFGADGRPSLAWCMAAVSAVDQTPLLNDAAMYALPDYPKDTAYSSIPAPTRNALLDALQARGFTKAQFSGASTYREALRIIGRRLYSAFNEDNLDVSG